MALRLVSWHVAGKPVWPLLAEVDGDIGLLQEASLLFDAWLQRVVPDPAGDWATAGWTGRIWKRRTAVVQVSDRCPIRPAVALTTVGLAGSGEVAISHAGALAVAETSFGDEVITIASLYAPWEYSSSRSIYADTSAHRLLSDLSTLVHNRRGHRAERAGPVGSQRPLSRHHRPTLRTPGVARAPAPDPCVGVDASSSARAFAKPHEVSRPVWTSIPRSASDMEHPGALRFAAAPGDSCAVAGTVDLGLSILSIPGTIEGMTTGTEADVPPATYDRTVFPLVGPDPDFDALVQHLKAMTQPQLVIDDDHRIPLPKPVAEALREVVDSLAQGHAVTIAPHHTTLTTQEAADLLGVSRPTLVKLLEADVIPHTRPGRHRRVRLSDVLGYQHRQQLERDAALDELAAISDEAGLYDQHPPTGPRSS